jgi:hypothetical protein
MTKSQFKFLVPTAWEPEFILREDSYSVEEIASIFWVGIMRV